MPNYGHHIFANQRMIVADVSQEAFTPTEKLLLLKHLTYRDTDNEEHIYSIGLLESVEDYLSNSNPDHEMTKNRRVLMDKLNSLLGELRVHHPEAGYFRIVKT